MWHCRLTTAIEIGESLLVRRAVRSPCDEFLFYVRVLTRRRTDRHPYPHPTGAYYIALRYCIRRDALERKNTKLIYETLGMTYAGVSGFMSDRGYEQAIYLIRSIQIGLRDKAFGSCSKIFATCVQPYRYWPNWSSWGRGLILADEKMHPKF